MPVYSWTHGVCVKEVRQISKGVEAQKRGKELASWVSWQGKDYDWSMMLEQLGLRERERGQQLAQRAHRWMDWVGSGQAFQTDFWVKPSASQKTLA